MIMKHVLAILPDPTDATSFYRAIGPLGYLKRTMGAGLSLSISGDIDWTPLKMCDIIFQQRPFTDVHLRITQMAKSSRKKIWLDYDDNLFEVPPCNWKHEIYWRPETHTNVVEILKLADVVTVSTEHLKQVYGPYTKQQPVVVPNAFDDDILGPIWETPYDRDRRLVWRGSSSHDKDLVMFTKPLYQVACAHRDWLYEFMGEPFWGVTEAIRKAVGSTQIVMTKPMEPGSFFHVLKMKRPTVVIVPLEDNSFNRSKSNCAWIEATHAGAVTLAPDWPEWHRPGIVGYQNPEDFQDKLSGILSGHYNVPALWQQSRDYIDQHLTLTQINKTRQEIILSL